MNLTPEQWAKVQEYGKRVGAPYHSWRKWPKYKTVPWKFRNEILELAEADGFALPANWLKRDAA